MVKALLNKIADSYSDQFYAVFRILAGFLFFQHGAQKLFGWFTKNPPVEIYSLFGLAGVI